MSDNTDAPEASSLQTATPISLPLRIRRAPLLSPFGRGWPIQSPSTTNESSSNAPIRAQGSRCRAPAVFNGSSELRPLYLLEINKKLPQPEESLPSLPSSHTSSVGPPNQGSDDDDNATSKSQRNSGLRQFEFEGITTGALSQETSNKSSDEQKDAAQTIFVFGQPQQPTTSEPTPDATESDDDDDFLAIDMRAAILDIEKERLDAFTAARRAVDSDTNQSRAQCTGDSQEKERAVAGHRPKASFKRRIEPTVPREVIGVLHDQDEDFLIEQEMRRERDSHPDRFAAAYLEHFTYKKQKTPAELAQEAEEREWVEMNNTDDDS